MPAITPLIWRNLRRLRNQGVVMVALVILTSLVLNLGMVTLTGYAANTSSRAEQLQTEDALIVTWDLPRASALVDRLQADSRVATVDDPLAKSLDFASFDFNDTVMNAMTVFVPADGRPEFWHYQVVSELATPVTNPIWLPRLLQSSGGYELGDTFTLDTSTESTTFHVQGFTEWVMLGNINTGAIGLVLGEPQYAQLDANFAALNDVALVRIGTHADADADAVIADALAATKVSDPQAGLWAHSLRLVQEVSSMGGNINAALLVAFALLLAAVVVVVLRFLIKNSIERDMPAIGSAKAVGFSSRQITGALGVPFALLAGVASLIGVGLSYLLLPVLADSLVKQSGIGWTPGFSPLAMAVSVAVMTGTVLGTALASSRRIAKVEPVVALRGGITTHSMRRNLLPLHRSPGPLSLLLGLKESYQRIGQGLMVAVVVAMVTGTGIFALTIRDNWLGGSQGFMDLMIGDFEDVSVIRQPDADADQLLTEVAANPDVRKAFYVDHMTITYQGRSDLQVRVVDDFAQLDHDSVYSGRTPRHDNEVAIGGKMAQVYDKQVGDTITFSGPSGEKAYLITGLVQSTRAVGFETFMTSGGFEQVDAHFQPISLAIYLNDANDVSKVMDWLRAKHGTQLLSIMDTHSYMSSATQVYFAMMDNLSLGMLGLTGAVTLLVVGLAASTTVVESTRSLGVRKALGFTSGDLMNQLVTLNLPATLLGTAGGVLLAAITINPLLGVMMAGAGVMKVNLVIEPGSTGLLCAAIVVLAMATTITLSQSVRRISPYRLIAE